MLLHHPSPPPPPFLSSYLPLQSQAIDAVAVDASPIIGPAYLVLLTLQYGSQPLLSKRFVRRKVIVTSLVLACEVAKALCAVLLLALKKRGALRWRLSEALTVSMLPTGIYAVHNSLPQILYKNLDSLTFSILNQTKLFFTALFTFLFLVQRQSRRLVLALGLLILAAVSYSNHNFLIN